LAENHFDLNMNKPKYIQILKDKRFTSIVYLYLGAILRNSQ
jgi:hypothetical protein